MKSKEISICVNNVTISGNLNVPARSVGLVIFSHGSGSSRFSPRNQHVADILNKNNIATLLVDLLTESEDRVYANRFNIPLLTERLVSVTDFASSLTELKDLPLGYFGASTGAASALRAAATIPGKIQAVVSRGGRPDLASDLLAKVKSPTLLIVGSFDTEVISLNRDTYSKMKCYKELRIVNGASHLFEEPGKLNEVAKLAVDWFNKYLVLNLITKH